MGSAASSATCRRSLQRKENEEKPLYLKKERFTEDHRTFEIIVDQKPTVACIDPYNKLIDRNADDNMIDVTNK